MSPYVNCLLYLTAHSFKTFENMLATLLFMFAAQQQNCTFRQQNSGSFYLEFSTEFNELIHK